MRPMYLRDAKKPIIGMMSAALVLAAALVFIGRAIETTATKAAIKHNCETLWLDQYEYVQDCITETTDMISNWRKNNG